MSGRAPFGSADRVLSEVTTVGDLVSRSAARAPQNLALVFPGRRLTYGELADRAIEAARSLAALGVAKGDRVGILMPNCPELVEVLVGAALLGAVVVPVNARFKQAELAYIVDHADIAVLCTTDLVADYVDFVALLSASLPGLAGSANPRNLGLADTPALRCTVLFGSTVAPGFLSEAEFRQAAAEVSADQVARRAERVRVRDRAIMMYTSGTTDRPKGCVLSHEAVVRNARAARRRFALSSGDRFWDPLPLFHMGGVLPWLACVDAGATFLTSSHFEPEEALALMAGQHVTFLYPTFPTITQALIHHRAFAETDLSGVRAMLNVAPVDQLRSMQAALPQAVQIGSYGCTEVGGVVAYNELEDDLDQRLTTCGRPFPGIEVQVVDPDTQTPLPPGAPGEILVRGYSLFDGYHKDPEQTAAVLDAEGWFHTGDLGSLDDGGRISYRGRLKDMLKVGGENVAAAEIESFLCNHPAVKIVQVVGMPDDRLVEVPVAFVELHDGETVGADELIAFCTGRIASFKVPRQVRFVDQWPMSATKIQKFRLRQQLQAG